MAGSAEGGGKLPQIIGLVVVLGLLGALAWKFMQPSSDPVVQGMSADPQAALCTYLQVAEDYYFGRASLWDFEKVVTKDDYQWFQGNAEKLFASRDAFGISSAADPTAVAATARSAIMRDLLEQGPHKTSAQVVSSDVVGDTATFVVRQPEADTQGAYYVESRVTLVREGRQWCMKDFGGGRAVYENRNRPEDRKVVRGPMPDIGGAGPSADPGGFPDPGVPTGPEALARAQQLINQAAAAWDQLRYPDSLAAAREALAIYEANLGPNDPQIHQVRQMVQAAEAQVGG